MSCNTCSEVALPDYLEKVLKRIENDPTKAACACLIRSNRGFPISMSCIPEEAPTPGYYGPFTHSEIMWLIWKVKNFKLYGSVDWISGYGTDNPRSHVGTFFGKLPRNTPTHPDGTGCQGSPTNCSPDWPLHPNIYDLDKIEDFICSEEFHTSGYAHVEPNPWDSDVTIWLHPISTFRGIIHPVIQYNDFYYIRMNISLGGGFFGWLGVDIGGPDASGSGTFVLRGKSVAAPQFLNGTQNPDSFVNGGSILVMAGDERQED